MVEICTDLDEMYFVALLDLQADVFQCLLDGCSKGFSPVFHGTDQVIEEKRFVMTLENVITHEVMLQAGKGSRTLSAE